MTAIQAELNGFRDNKGGSVITGQWIEEANSVSRVELLIPVGTYWCKPTLWNFEFLIDIGYVLTIPYD